MQIRSSEETYYTISQNMQIQDQWYLGIAEAEGLEFWGWEFTICKIYEGPSPVFVPITQGGKEMALSFGGVDALHVPFKDAPSLMQDINDSTQLVAAMIGGERIQYSIVNALTKVDCIDYKNTKGEKYNAEQIKKDPSLINRYKHIRELFLQRSKIEGHDFFRLENSLGTLVVSKKFKDNVEQLYKSNHGAVFTPVSLS